MFLKYFLKLDRWEDVENYVDKTQDQMVIEIFVYDTPTSIGTLLEQWTVLFQRNKQYSSFETLDGKKFDNFMFSLLKIIILFTRSLPLMKLGQNIHEIKYRICPTKESKFVDITEEKWFPSKKKYGDFIGLTSKNSSDLLLSIKIEHLKKYNVVSKLTKIIIIDYVDKKNSQNISIPNSKEPENEFINVGSLPYENNNPTTEQYVNIGSAPTNNFQNSINAFRQPHQISPPTNFIPYSSKIPSSHNQQENSNDKENILEKPVIRTRVSSTSLSISPFRSPSSLSITPNIQTQNIDANLPQDMGGTPPLTSTIAQMPFSSSYLSSRSGQEQLQNTNLSNQTENILNSDDQVMFWDTNQKLTLDQITKQKIQLPPLKFDNDFYTVLKN